MEQNESFKTSQRINSQARVHAINTSVRHERKSSRARAFVIFGPLKTLSQIGQRIGCQWKRLVNAGGDGYCNMNPSKYPEEKTV